MIARTPRGRSKMMLREREQKRKYGGRRQTEGWKEREKQTGVRVDGMKRTKEKRC